MSTTALTKATERLERLKQSISKHKEAGKAALRRGGLGGAVLAGTAIAAVVDAVMTENSTTGDALLPGTEVPANAAIGGALFFAGLAGLADDYSDHAALIGAGMLAPKVYEIVRNAAEKRG